MQVFVQFYAVCPLETNPSWGRCQPWSINQGLLYHVMARNNDGQKIFLRQSDYQAFFEALQSVRQRYPMSLYGDLISNQFQLLFRKC